MKNGIKVTLFLSILVLLLGVANRFFSVSSPQFELAQMTIKGYQELEEDSVDVLFVGNSHLYNFWQNTFAWKEYGIAAGTWSVARIPFGIVRTSIIEATKKQSPKVVVVEASSFTKDDTEEMNQFVYLVLSNIPYSKNYFDMANDFCDSNQIYGSDRWPYYVPLLQFHSRWNDLSEADFIVRKSYLNASYSISDLNGTLEETEHLSTNVVGSLNDANEKCLVQLLDWCDSQPIEFLFYFAPIFADENRLEQHNKIKQDIEAHGYTVLDFNEQELFESLDFNVTSDYKNLGHTNLRGSYKFTSYLSKYLIENYELPDHRGEDRYIKWEELSSDYYNDFGMYFQ